MTTLLRQLLDQAASDIDTLRHPDIDAFREAINPVLHAAGEGGIGDHDKIDSINEFNGYISIDTSYSVRCCPMNHTYRLTAAVVDAQDPVKVAERERVARELNAQQRVVAHLCAQLIQAETNLAALELQQKELAA